MYVVEDFYEDVLKRIEENGFCIEVLPYDVTEMVCEALKDSSAFRFAVVSIDDKGFGPTRIEMGPAIAGVHRMNFADIDDCDADYLFKYAAKQEDLNGLRAFLDKVIVNCDFLIVHCAAGISRSPAVASVIEEYLGYEDTIWNSGRYHPNRHVYKLVLKEFGIEKSEKEIDQKYQMLKI